MRRQVASMLEINDGLRPFAPQRAQPLPAYQNSRQMPQWPQPGAAGNRSSAPFSSAQVPRGYDSSMGGTSRQSPGAPPPSWAVPRMQGLSAGLPLSMYSSPQRWPRADVQGAAGGDARSAPTRPQGQDVPNGLGGMSRLREQGHAPYHFRQLPDGPGPRGAASSNPNCQAYLALQGTPVMALILDLAGVGRWQMCKFYWPALEPNLQGDYLDTVVLQRDEVARRVARHIVSPLISHRLGNEWTAGDWGTPHPTPTLDAQMINSGSFGTISFRAMNDLLLFAANNPTAAPIAIIHAVVQADCEPLRHLVEHRFRIHISVQKPSATVLPAPSGFQGTGVHSLQPHSLACSRASESAVRSSGHRNR